MKKYVSIDQGTTSSRCMIFALDGQCVGVSCCEQAIRARIGFTRPKRFMSVLIRFFSSSQCLILESDVAISITNQRETTIV